MENGSTDTNLGAKTEKWHVFRELTGYKSRYAGSYLDQARRQAWRDSVRS